jgi:hypothetical protein
MGLLDWLFGPENDGDDYGDSWHSYKERADHLREVYGWTVSEPQPRGGGNWLPLGGGYDDDRDGGGWSW